MARPKLGETETERMQLKITSAEIEAIDDWRFSNRVPSRSEAVRRLCASAIVAFRGFDVLKSMAEDASVGALDDREHVGGLFRGVLDDAINGTEKTYTHGEIKDLLHDLSDRAYWQEQNSRYLNRVITGLHDALAMYSQPQAFAAAEMRATELLEGLDFFIAQQHEGWDILAEHHARSAVIRMMSDEERQTLNAIEDREERIAYLDKKVSKYQSSRRRRQKRLRDKIRAEDEKIRIAAQERFLQKKSLDDPEVEE